MKNLVCDFCDSVRIGLNKGIETFKKEFQSCREIRKNAKQMNTNFKPQVTGDKEMLEKIKEIRGTADFAYDPNKSYIPDEK